MRKQDFTRVSEYVWEVPSDFRDDMNVPARLYASERLLEEALRDKATEQLINTTTLPGLVKHALAMPDFHQGYGFPIGGVVASRTDDGIISPGGVGFSSEAIGPADLLSVSGTAVINAAERTPGIAAIRSCNWR